MAILPIQATSIKNINFCSNHKINERFTIRNQGLTQDVIEINGKKKIKI